MLLVAATQGTDKTELLSQRDVHITVFVEKSRTCSVKTEMDKSEAASYLSLHFDGSEQNKFSLPQLITHSKDERCHPLTVHLIGVLKHATVSLIDTIHI